jgi:cell division protein FtsA
MAVEGDILVAIDVGAHKVLAVLAEQQAEKIKILGKKLILLNTGETGIVDSVDISKAISTATGEVKKQSRANFLSARVNIADESLKTDIWDRHYSILSGEVSKDDVLTLVEQGTAVIKTKGEQTLGTAVNRFSVDGQNYCIKYPVGREAQILALKSYVETISKEAIANVSQSVEGSGVNVSSWMLDSVAGASVCLSDSEKNLGACFLDLGATHTKYSVFTQDGLVRSRVISLAGNYITQMIASSFLTSFNEAERLKKYYGCAHLKSAPKDRLVGFEQSNTKGKRYLSLHQLTEVIQKAYLVIFSHIKKDLIAQKLHRSLNFGIMLSGGASFIPSCQQLLLEYLKIRVKKAVIKDNHFEHEEQVTNNIDYVVALGLLLDKDDEFYLQDFKSMSASDSKIKLMKKVKKYGF